MVGGASVSNHFDQVLRQSWPKTISGVGRAVYTVFTTPSTPGHDETLYIEVARRLQNQAIPSLPPLEKELSAIEDVASDLGAAASTQRRINDREFLGITGILMQFTSYLPNLRPYCVTPFADTEKLYQAIIAQGHATPLSFSEQLAIALEQTSGNTVEALWRLFITSRLYARWFDTNVISDMPSFSRTEILQRMETFSRSVAACKPHGKYPSQDTSGDAYYCWTHALGKVLYKTCAPRWSPLAGLEALALHNGTRLNHGVAHRYKSQRLESDHTIAAAYGNAIGKVIAAKNL